MKDGRELEPLVDEAFQFLCKPNRLDRRIPSIRWTTHYGWHRKDVMGAAMRVSAQLAGEAHGSDSLEALLSDAVERLRTYGLGRTEPSPRNLEEAANAGLRWLEQKAQEETPVNDTTQIVTWGVVAAITVAAAAAAVWWVWSRRSESKDRAPVAALFQSAASGDDDALRRLLDLSGEHGVVSITPRPDSPFDPEQMEDTSGLSGDYRKLVIDTVRAGVRVGQQVLRARVRCRTQDVDLLLVGEDPVSLYLKANLERHLGGSATTRDAWRAQDGLREPELLLENLDVSVLLEWSENVVSRFVEASGPGLPRVGPEVHDDFEPAWMTVNGEQPLGRARVTDVLRHGLAAPGGYAILQALVTVEEVG